jgi:hypothetical protein
MSLRSMSLAENAAPFRSEMPFKQLDLRIPLTLEPERTGCPDICFILS